MLVSIQDQRRSQPETYSDVGIYDRVVIQDILKEIAQTQQVDLSAKQRFKGALCRQLAQELHWRDYDI